MRLLHFFLTCLVMGATQAGAEDIPGSGMNVNVRHGLLAVDIANGVPLSEVPHAIALQAGFRLTIMGNLGDTQAQTFTNVPLERGIARLVSNHSLLMINDPSAGHQSVARVYEASHSKECAIQPSPPLLLPAF